jgi:FkbM family methyltransferase
MKQFLKKTIRPRLIPPLRAYIRYMPAHVGKRRLWKSVVASHLGWLPHHFVASTQFGRKIAGNTEDFVQRHIYYFGLWEPNLTSFLSERLRPGDVFIDVGANIGYFTLLASTLVGDAGRVVAVEASPSIFAALQSNVSRNDARNVRCVNMAASDREATLRLYRGPSDNTAGTTLIPENIDGATFECEVPAKPLAGIVTAEEWKQARVVKVDVEGAEGAVARGMEPLLRDARDDLEVVMEITPRTLQLQGTSAENIIGAFRANGFHAYELSNDYQSDCYVPPITVRRPVRLAEPLRAQADVVFSRLDRASL